MIRRFLWLSTLIPCFVLGDSRPSRPLRVDLIMAKPTCSVAIRFLNKIFFTTTMLAPPVAVFPRNSISVRNQHRHWLDIPPTHINRFCPTKCFTGMIVPISASTRTVRASRQKSAGDKNIN